MNIFIWFWFVFNFEINIYIFIYSEKNIVSLYVLLCVFDFLIFNQ